MNEIPNTVDLTTCDSEPIHVIGRIQGFGWLIAFSGDWIINHISTNCGELFERPAASLIGAHATDIFSGKAMHAIRTHLQMLGSAESVERVFGIDLFQDGRDFDLALHISDRSYVLEIEPGEEGRRRDYAAYVRPMMERMRQSATVEDMCAAAARNLRGLTGFDRVMVYRFEADGAGEVVAESLNGNTDSYAGLHFPASDIPAQARRLYSRNLLRIITDVNDPTVPIVPQNGPSGGPLDLSMSMLRAVSPIHIEYLKNMGVQASMSVSIMRRGKLWGLMACHHYSPLYLSYSVRTAAELFGEFFAYLLEQKHAEVALEKRREASRLHDEIMARVAGGDTLLDAFEDFADAIHPVIPFDGIAAWVDGEFAARGSTPSREQFPDLARFLNTAGSSSAWATNNLAAAYPPAADFADKAAGLLALPVSRTPGDYIVLFREEQIRDVNWAGDPRKSVEVGPLGGRLTPRKSFELWREERRGHARPWDDDEIASAESLRVTLLEVVLRLADAAHVFREEAARHQDVLIAELNHRVRNILHLIRGLVSQSREGSRTIDEFADTVSSRIHALARAHDQITRTDWSPSSFHDLVRTECEAYAGGSTARIAISGPDAMISPEAFTTIALVVHELMTNSCKYGSLSDSAGHVDVTVRRKDDDTLAIEWRESEGPIVKQPQRRGFGSAIIERTIPHELGGFAEIEYPPEGLMASFMVPARYIASYGSVSPFRTEETKMPEPERVADHALKQRTALIVEDNIIIAMEAEDMLGSLGFSKCAIAGSRGEAQRIIEESDVGFAMLDINLGSETSEPIARLLQDRGTRFIFASGYGEGPFEPEEFGHVPTLTKPYSERDLLAAISKLFDD